MRNTTHIQLERNTIHIQLERNTTHIQLERNTTCIQLERNTTHIQLERNTIHIQLERNRNHIQLERNTTHIQLREKHSSHTIILTWMLVLYTGICVRHEIWPSQRKNEHLYRRGRPTQNMNRCYKSMYSVWSIPAILLYIYLYSTYCLSLSIRKVIYQCFKRWYRCYSPKVSCDVVPIAVCESFSCP